MKYLLLGDNCKSLYVEDDDKARSFRYTKEGWQPGGWDLWDARVGWDPSEEPPYRVGNFDLMLDIFEITKEQAEAFVGREISEQEIADLFEKR